MSGFRSNNSVILSADIIILIFCLLGVYQITQKADMPFSTGGNMPYLEVISRGGGLPEGISKGDRLIAVEGININSPEELEILLDSRHPGADVSALLGRSDGSIYYTNIKLTRFYSDFYLITIFITGILFFAIAIFILFMSPDRKEAHIFHLVTVATAIIILITWGNYTVPSSAAGAAVRVVFHTAYALAPVLFFHFTSVFPRDNEKKLFLLLPLLYIISVLMAARVNYSFLRLSFNISSDNIQAYSHEFTMLRLFLIVLVLLSIISFIISYRKSKYESDRKKLKWVLFGFLAAPGSFVLLWVIPQAVIKQGLVPEEIIILLMLAVPVSFSISIVRYHLMDIDLIINRSIVYSATIALFLLSYALCIYLLMQIIDGVSSGVPAAITAVVLALSLQPARSRIQAFVDKKFFRIRYNYASALKQFLTDINESTDDYSLGLRLATSIDNLIPIKQYSFYVFDQNSSDYAILVQKGRENSHKARLSVKASKLSSMLSEPLAVSDKTEEGVQLKKSSLGFFRRYSAALYFPLVSRQSDILAFIIIGDKLSGGRFSREDIELISHVVSESALIIERIRLSENLMKEHLEKEKLKDLNELKSFFISSVSHELKTPLTSIRLFSELMLQDNENTRRNTADYLRIIEGETERLERMIENVLDLSKIERGVKEFVFEDCDLREILLRSTELIAYQLTMEKCALEVCADNRQWPIRADAQAVESAVINLLTNAMKYSHEPKQIQARLEKQEDCYILSVWNNGSRFTAADLQRLSELYYRQPEHQTTRQKKISGTGIGLYLTRQIMKAHGGELLISNCKGEGCQFSLKFPTNRTGNSYEDHFDN